MPRSRLRFFEDDAWAKSTSDANNVNSQQHPTQLADTFNFINFFYFK